MSSLLLPLLTSIVDTSGFQIGRTLGWLRPGKVGWSSLRDPELALHGASVLSSAPNNRPGHVPCASSDTAPGLAGRPVCCVAAVVGKAAVMRRHLQEHL